MDALVKDLQCQHGFAKHQRVELSSTVGFAVEASIDCNFN